MAAVVVDASVLVDLLLTASAPARSALVGKDPFAPALVDAEVLSAITRLTRAGEMTEDRGRGAVRLLARAAIERVPIGPLLLDAWALRHNVGAYDALYVALAGRLDCPLVTADRKLAAATGLGVAVIVASTA